jgi:hypothetical protein
MGYIISLHTISLAINRLLNAVRVECKLSFEQEGTAMIMKLNAFLPVSSNFC